MTTARSARPVDDELRVHLDPSHPPLLGDVPVQPIHPLSSVIEVAESAVAWPAQDASNLASVMVVVDVQSFSRTASFTLLRELLPFFFCELVPAKRSEEAIAHLTDVLVATSI